MRGEYHKKASLSHCTWGSPPLARGIQRPCRIRARRPGITPACAGNTVVGTAGINRSRDHPRLRGEYESEVVAVEAVAGSPPLARGILLLYNLNFILLRITPACAGNTLKKSLIYNLFPISISKFHLVSQTPEML